ncbi:MAG: hypothetical protein ACRD2L_09755 [Terriglobia bacterium]
MTARISSNLLPLIQRFRELAISTQAQGSRQHGRHAARMKVGQVEAQIEMFLIAQAICALTQPKLQESLDKTRAAIVAEIVGYKHDLSSADAVVTPADHLKCLRWSWRDYQITPEVSHDPELAGRVVSYRLVTKLRHLHKAQVRVVLSQINP